MTDLLARLRKRKGGWKSNISYASGVGDLINPDGEEAAARIEALTSALEQLCGNAEIARLYMRHSEEAGIVASALFDTISQARTALTAPLQ